MKKRFLEEDLDKFEDHNILELLLFFGVAQKNTNEIAHNLLNTFGSLSAVFDASHSQLKKVPGVGDHIATLIKLIPSLSRAYIKDKTKCKLFITTEDLGAYILPHFLGISEEKLFVIYLDMKKNLLGSEFISEGSMNNVPIDYRKIIDGVLKYKASAIVVAHNHPGGIALPSMNDINSTKELSNILSFMDVKLFDHIIVADGDYISFRDSNIDF
ncbi:MAG: DNA repair protein RadC [Clostridia bacterium]|nr:DNA repair protein RadC [Clostridia bacterium]